MSDYTKSNYTKTGKKVKSIYDGHVDLTYNEVYDVFIDNKGDGFIIDDVGDKRYWGISDDDYYELIDDVGNDIHDTNETKPKFKVGDKVKVVNVKQISQWTKDIDVGYVGFVVDVNVNVEDTPYKVKLDKCYYDWWFTDKCIELVNDDTKSDYTKSNYTKTGKKVKCINSGQIDLIYKKVYDVFIDADCDKFVIDESGNRCYDSMEFPYWLEVFNGDADSTTTTNETDDGTKQKFNVGDTVKVTSIDYICQYDTNIKVGDIGVITEICNHKKIPYCVFDWYFPEDDLELVAEDKSNNSIKSDGSQIVSDGGSSSYYVQQIPKGMLERFNATGVIEAKDVIRLFLGNDFNMGNIFKAYCRVISLRNGKGKAGIDEQYDLTKAKYFTEDELNYYLENNNA